VHESGTSEPEPDATTSISKDAKRKQMIEINSYGEM
jgi:hypothetical protein